MTLAWIMDRSEMRATTIRWGPPAAALLIAGVLLFRSLRDPDSASPAERLLRGQVEHVYSGQSVKLDSDEKLEYAGIRAPYADEPLFEESRARNTELVHGREVRLRFDPYEPGSEERPPPYVFVDGEFVNETLVREGLAYVRLTPDSQRFAKELLAAQSEARKARRGLWKVQDQTAERIYPADPKYGNFHRPSCEETKKMRPDRRVDLRSRAAALEAGFAPCRACKP